MDDRQALIASFYERTLPGVKQAPESPMSVAFREHGAAKLQEGFANCNARWEARLPAIVEAAKEQGREQRSGLLALLVGLGVGVVIGFLLGWRLV